MLINNVSVTTAANVAAEATAVAETNAPSEKSKKKKRKADDDTQTAASSADPIPKKKRTKTYPRKKTMARKSIPIVHDLSDDAPGVAETQATPVDVVELFAATMLKCLQKPSTINPMLIHLLK